MSGLRVRITPLDPRRELAGLPVTVVDEFFFMLGGQWHYMVTKLLHDAVELCDYLASGDDGFYVSHLSEVTGYLEHSCYIIRHLPVEACHAARG